MKTRIQKIIAAIGLAALCLSAAYAGSFSQNVTKGTGFSGAWSGSVNVPNAGNCTQYLYAPNSSSFIINHGPLGNYSLWGWESLSRLYQGAIPAGNYGIYLQVDNGGSSVVGISW
ncbi:MAG TPA: hypothetical protein VIM71_02300 [Lacunisphaera sp.]